VPTTEVKQEWSARKEEEEGLIGMGNRGLLPIGEGRVAVLRENNRLMAKGEKWGTCMGFQLLSILGANNHSVLEENAFDSENLPLALNFTEAASQSRMFGGAPSDSMVFRFWFLRIR